MTGSQMIMFISFSKCGSWADLDKRTMSPTIDFMICMERLLFFSVVILSPLFPKAWAIKLDYFIFVLYPESRTDQKQECIYNKTQENKDCIHELNLDFRFHLPEHECVKRYS